MTNALIGHTGFVGGNLKRQARFDALYDSKTVGTLGEAEHELVVCAAPSAVKWLANKEPEQDRASIGRLTDALDGARAARFVLMSTVDVYPTPVDVDEDSAIEGDIQPYGQHRLELERFVAERFPEHLIVRLPGLFGPGLKKNVVYDFLHRNRLGAIPADGVFQFYDLANLWADLERARDAGLRLANFATEPVSVREVAREAFGFEFENPAVTARPRYDFHTKHAGVWGRSGPYLYDRGQVLAGMRAFVAAERERLA